MFLKRVVLNGFKSFADRTQFEFGPGRTAIVGPNGCGKSNVLDAVRWVLGEQSARSLRGERMQDVIFAGSRTRKPANFAEVELTFDNTPPGLACPEPEVTVSRLLYRSGESEYRLNGKRCRMKDIRDLFLDTGVGADAYGLIEQGRVDVMLQASRQERREIFEEAAGISRYRVRRAEAQRKLERTHNNLLRLNDVIAELERRLRSVKLAAGKARKFQEYDARLRELRATWSLREYHQLQQALDEQRRRAGSLSDELQTSRTELAQRDADTAELEAQLQAADEKIQAAQTQLQTLEAECGAAAERITQGQRRLADLRESRQRQEGLVEQASRQAVELAARLAQERSALDELRAAQAQATERMTALEARRGELESRCQQVQVRLEHERTAAFEAARHATRLNNEHKNLEQAGRQLAAQAAALADRQQRVAAEGTDLEARREELELRTRELGQQSSDLSEAARGLEAQLAELEARLAECEQQIAELKQTRSGVVSQLELLQDMERRQEGVGQGVRWVLEWSQPGETPAGSVVGLVADVLHIDDPRVGALQSVLARFEDHLVVRDSYAFLAELSRRGTPPGPVAVIALDRLPQRSTLPSYRDAPGFVAEALDWVRCAEELRPLAAGLLGRVIVVDQLERALALAQNAPHGCVFVTPEGHAVESGGRLVIAGPSAAAGLVSRKAEIRRLQARLDELETTLERAARERNTRQEQTSDLRLQREALLQQIATVQRQHADAQTELVRLHDEQARLERELAVLRSESAELERARAATLERIRQVGLEREVIGENQARHEAQLERLSNERATLSDELARLSEQLTGARVEAGRIAERCRARADALAELQARLEALESERQRAAGEAAAAEQRIVRAEAELACDRELHAELEQRCAQQRAAVLELRQGRQQLQQQLEAGRAAARQLQSQAEELSGRLNACEIALRETEVRQEALVARVAEELRLDLAALYGSYEPTEQDWEAIRSEIEALRGKIARLGNVNLDALAELEELTPRYENLIAQREDLLAAVNRLERLIQQLDEESRVRFLNCFEEVGEHFHELFRKLFGGGKADLILDDPANPLECGIEIIARPPGKEARAISLLSGGEKTLTAVALLFALFRRRPSPFAILDEVDAALDESNIDRFNIMLNDFLAESQFILITHNKRTMQCADVLYGVTMEEPGVSKRVSVRFEQRVETPSVA